MSERGASLIARLKQGKNNLAALKAALAKKTSPAGKANLQDAIIQQADLNDKVEAALKAQGVDPRKVR